MNVAVESIIFLVFGIIIGIVAGYFIARFILQRQLEKNPPLNEVVVTEMMKQMGRTPSAKQVQAVLRASQQSNASTKKKKDKKDKK
ncbi:YneF family protein [Culicoidibacter larvae]|uniref:YneF family protein n=1 Tax=Culicoidibacter larvae TaxID=2579976 RepID=A0A5R8Q8V0_9FIRM|nr:YneF family protein [Culicoidibacter larvae]TLG72142.1 YneF family protein [Culicoidibacter larvae]